MPYTTCYECREHISETEADDCGGKCEYCWGLDVEDEE